MKRLVVRGIVREIRPVVAGLTLVTLNPFFDDFYEQIQVPLYMPGVNPRLKSREVKIATTRFGLFGSRFRQAIESSDGMEVYEVDFSVVKRAIRSYKERQRKLDEMIDKISSDYNPNTLFMQ